MVAEVALAVVLVVGAGLATKSFARLLDIDPGLHSRTTCWRSGSASRTSEYGDDRVRGYYQSLLDRIAAVPGVEAVGAGEGLSRSGAPASCALRRFLAARRAPRDRPVRLPVLHVSADYFRAMGVPLREGRTFTTADREERTARVDRERSVREALLP